MKVKRCFKTIAIIAALPVVLLLGINVWMYMSYHGKIHKPFVSTGPNAVWARHHWAGKNHHENEYKTFFNKLKQNRITDVYFHVGPWVEDDGGISADKYEYADELVINASNLYPDLRIHAWIGQMTVQGSGSLDLSNQQIQNNIINTAKIFLDMGFDGIHYDFEPVHSADAAFIELLKRTATITRKKGGVLSVACGQVEVVPYSNRFFKVVAPNASFWTTDYFIRVSDHVDQIAVMIYDTALPADWLYGMYVKNRWKH